MRTFSLAEDGDSFEREWAPVVLKNRPEFEKFWQRHIVPLTYRVADEAVRSHFVRPSIKTRYADVADAHYAVFYHLAQSWSAMRQIADDVYRQEESAASTSASTEALYCYFAHAVSAHDSLLHFAAAVNEFESSAGPFVFNYGGRPGSVPVGLKKVRRGQSFDALNDAIELLKQYRNLVIHRRIVFLQNGYLPLSVGRKKTDYVGLRGISRMARDLDNLRKSGEFEKHFTEAVPWLEARLDSLIEAMRPVWSEALIFMDRLATNSADYRSKRDSIAARDRQLTKARIEQTRTLGRVRNAGESGS